MNETSEVKLHFLDYWRVIRVRWAILVIAFTLVMVTAGITCFFLPRQFYSRVKMEVKSDNNTIKIFSNENAYQTVRDPSLQPTQFQILQSKEILYPVIDNLKLVDSWSSQEGTPLPKEEVYIMLRNRMELSTIRNTDFIEVGIYSTDRVEAANIANMIAVVYQKVRRDDQMQLRDTGLAQLREEVANQRKSVEAAQQEMQRIRDRDKIIDPNPESMDAPDFARQVVADDEAQYNAAKIKHAELVSRYEQTAKLKPEELMTALTSLDIADPTISKVLPLFQDACSEEARLLNGGLGENHPRVKALRAQKEVFSKQLMDGINAVRNALAIKIKVSEANMAALEEKVTRTKDRYNQETGQSQEYVNVKTSYLNAKKLLEAAETRHSSESLQLKMTVVPAKIWEKAEPAIYPSKPKVWVYMLFGVIVGLFVGTGLAFFIEYLDTSVKTLDDIERFLKAPVLAVIPKGIVSLLKLEGDAPDAEAYRILRTNMEFNCKNPNAKTITVVSGGPGEGKSTTLNNLAVTCAKGGYSVLIVDADLRRPSQHTYFEVESSPGLSDVLTGKLRFEDVIQRTALANLSFLPAGELPDDAVGILNSQSMIDLIAALRNHYDLIFFDSPPILGVSDASILASEVDLCIMVVQYRRFPRAMLQRVKNAVENVGGHLLGVVLNNVETKHDSGYQYYTQYYDYYTPDVKRRKAKAAQSAKAAAAKAAVTTGANSSNPGDY